MAPTTTTHLDDIRALLAEKGYEVTESGGNVLTIRDVHTGIPIHAVLEGDILFLSLTCTTVPQASLTAEAMHRMLDAGNGISTSYFQLYDAGEGKTAVTLNNFCKLQDMGPDDKDDVLSCVNFLLVDVMAARGVLGGVIA